MTRRRAVGAPQPGDVDYHPTRHEADAFNRAFRSATWPRVIDRRVRDRHMEPAHWDVEQAVESLRQEEMQHLGNNQAASQVVTAQNSYPYNSSGPARASNASSTSNNSFNPQLAAAHAANTMPTYTMRPGSLPYGFYTTSTALAPGVSPYAYLPRPNPLGLPVVPRTANRGNLQSQQHFNNPPMNSAPGRSEEDEQKQEHQKTIDEEYPPARMAELIRKLPRNPQNIEQERRDAALAFRNNLLKRSGEKARLSISQAILLLHLAEWDMGAAVSAFSTLDEALDRLHVLFDRMRSSEGNKLSKETTVNGRQERQSERLALLISITARSDWKSLRALLAEKGFNLIEALLHWFQYGIQVVPQKVTRTAPKAKKTTTTSNKVSHQKKVFDDKSTRKDAYCNNIPAPSATAVVAPPVDRFWASEPDFYRRVLGYSGSEAIIPVPDAREDDRFRAFGFLIHPNRAPLQPGHYHVEDYFTIEYIAKNDYWHKRFAKEIVTKKLGSRFKWPKLGAGYGKDNTPDNDPADDKTVQFDFKNRTHVDLLNNWRRQIFSRVTGVKNRVASQQWQPIELAKLYFLVEELWDDYVIRNPGPADGEEYTLPVSQRQLEDWADLLNEFFLGTRPGNTAQIRGERTWEAVGTQARRTSPITEEFHIPEDKSWLSKKPKDYRADQRREIAFGKDLLADWKPDAERLKTKQQALPSPPDNDAGEPTKKKKRPKPLPVEDDSLSDPNDSDATKERKAHSERSRAKLLDESGSRWEEREARRNQRAKNGEPTDDGKDVLADWRARVVDAGGDEDDDEGGDDGGGAPVLGKRKRADIDESDDESAGCDNDHEE